MTPVPYAMKMFKRISLCALSAAVALACGACSSTETVTASDTTSAESTANDTASTESTSSADSSTQSAASSGSSSEAAGVSDIATTDADSANTALTSGSATVSIGSTSIDLSGAYVVDGVDAVINGGTYSSTGTDENVFLVINGGSLTISNAEITKTGDAGESDSTRTSDVSDDYNFYGINSVVLVVGEGSSAALTDCIITSDASGANAIFATDSAAIDVENVRITTTGSSSRGVYATYEGTVNANHVDITTSSAHCAHIATDRGGGYVTVTNSTVTCSGDGSPCIYSTGEITVENVVGVSAGAQAAVIEGKNSITMTSCSFTVSDANNGVMLYQSMSGDAADSDATATYSTLTMTDTEIVNNSDGPMFYVTNTTSVVNIYGDCSFTNASGTLISAAADSWGNDGSNGGSLTFNLYSGELTGDITADDISDITLYLADGASVDGETSGSVTVSADTLPAA